MRTLRITLIASTVALLASVAQPSQAQALGLNGRGALSGTVGGSLQGRPNDLVGAGRTTVDGVRQRGRDAAGRVTEKVGERNDAARERVQGVGDSLRNARGEVAGQGQGQGEATVGRGAALLGGSGAAEGLLGAAPAQAATPAQPAMPAVPAEPGTNEATPAQPAQPAQPPKPLLQGSATGEGQMNLSGAQGRSVEASGKTEAQGSAKRGELKGGVKAEGNAKVKGGPRS